MKPTTIKVDGKDVEAMPFTIDVFLSRGIKQDRITAVYTSGYLGHGQIFNKNFWGIEDLDEGKAGVCIAAALDYFWPGWRERHPSKVYR